MLPDLLNILPQSLSEIGIAACIAGLFGGVMLWLTGAAWSRWAVTLIGVGVGAYAGAMLPRWYLWPVNSMSVAVLGAVVLGVLAFVGQRLAVGLVLGAVLVAWACFGTWLLMHGTEQLAPRQDWELAKMETPQYAQDLWQRLPEPVQRVTPYAAATAMISGLCVTLLWPRVGRVLMGSTLGLTIAVVCGLTLVHTQRTAWLKFIPPDVGLEAAILGALVILGSLVQWQLLPGRKEVRSLEEERQQAQQPIRRYGEMNPSSP